MSEEHPAGAGRARYGLLNRLVVAVNSVLILVAGAFLLWDYSSGMHALIAQKRLTLQDEARVLLGSIERLQSHGPSSVQGYIDDVCGAMQETTSPGHHIAVEMGDQVVQARSHRRASPELLAAMRRAAADPGGVSRAGDAMVVVGEESQEGLTVYVSEYVRNIVRAARGQLMLRFAGIALAGAILSIGSGAALRRLLGRPLVQMVGAVRRFAEGNLDQRMPPMASTELGAVADEFNDMARVLQAVNAQRRRDMDKAQRIQENLQPDLAAVTGASVSCLFRPAAEVAGDYYDVMRCADGSTIFCIADASGHGVPAAMAAAMLKAILQITVERESRPGALLAIVNRAFCRIGLVEDFATMLLARQSHGDPFLTFANAGHEPGILLRDGEQEALLEATGPVLGVHESAQWSEGRTGICAGDRLVLTTDGLAETASPDGVLFGRERLLQLITRTWDAPVADVPRLVLDSIQSYRESADQADDLTILAIEFC